MASAPLIKSAHDNGVPRAAAITWLQPATVRPTWRVQRFSRRSRNPAPSTMPAAGTVLCSTAFRPACLTGLTSSRLSVAMIVVFRPVYQWLKPRSGGEPHGRKPNVLAVRLTALGPISRSRRVSDGRSALPSTLAHCSVSPCQRLSSRLSRWAPSITSLVRSA